MRFLSTTALVSAMGLWSAMSADQPAPVITEYGLVQGAAENDLTVYRGEAFAAPPIGELRWRLPQPAAKWAGVEETTKFAPDPFQGHGSGKVSEDCLYLNVWMPTESADVRLPLLVWIYGEVMYFNQKPYPGSIPSAASLAELDAYFKWRRTPEGDAGAK